MKKLKIKTSQNYLKSLFLLRTLYRVYLDLLTMFCTRKVYICNNYQLNEWYLRLSQMIEEVGGTPEFKDLKCGRPFRNLLVIDGESDVDLDICWEYGVSRQCSDIYSKIEEIYVREGLNSFEIDEQTEDFLNEIKKGIKLFQATPELITSNRMLTIKGVEDRFVIKDVPAEGIEIHSEDKKEEKDFSRQGDIILDKHILLRCEYKDYFLLMQCKDKEYSYKERISRQAFRIIKYLYEIRNRVEGLKLGEIMRVPDLASNTRTITDRIREINQLCKARKVKNIFHKHPEHRWGLNKNLGCFN